MLAFVQPSVGLQVGQAPYHVVDPVSARSLESSAVLASTPSSRTRSSAVPAAAAAAAAVSAVATSRSAAALRRGRRTLIACRADAAVAAGAPGSVTAVLLSGGVGKRMGAKIPKQYLKLLGLEIALHSLDTFLECSLISELVVVVADEYKYVFEEHLAKKGTSKPVHYTNGGAERQDSVQNGLAKATSEYVAVHDAARPLVTVAEVEKVIGDAKTHGAALLAVNTKATIKQAAKNEDGDPVVEATPNRKLLWEAHTPQVIRSELLREGFANAAAKDLVVTDDVSLIEALGKPVKLTEGEYTNLKVTTPEDMSVAEAILRERGYEAS